MSVTGYLMILMGSAALCVTACSPTSDHKEPSEGAGNAPSTSSAIGPADEKPGAVAPPPRPELVDLSRVPTTVIAPDLSSLLSSGTTPVPWTDFFGNPENGRPQTLSSGRHTMPIKRSAYLRESAVWDTGIIWYSDYGLEFMSWDGQQTKIKGGKGWYGQNAFTADKVYFVRRGDLMSVAAHDLTVRLEAHAADLAGSAGDDSSRVALAGLIADGDPVVRVTSRENGKSVSRLYSLDRGYVPLPERWTYTGGKVAVGADPTRKTWTAYDTNTYEPLWSRRFTDGKKRIRLYMSDQIPGGKLSLSKPSTRATCTSLRHGPAG